MEKVVLKLEKRVKVGTNASKALRNQNKVPFVLFEKGADSLHLVADEKDVNRLLIKSHAGSTLYANIDGEEHFAILKNVQYHPVNAKVLHVDLQALQAGVAVKVSIPVFIYGKDELRGVFCQEILSEIEIECLPKDLVDKVEITLDQPEIGEQVSVGELEIFKSGKITPITDADSIVYVISELRENVIEEEDASDDEVAEPELIGAEKVEEE